MYLLVRVKNFTINLLLFRGMIIVKRIMLICSGGMSTSLLCTKIQKSAKEKNIDVEVFAVSEAEMKRRLDNVDVILLGPQVRYLLSKIKNDVEEKGIAVDVIESISYGTMNGEAVLKQAMSLME